MRASKNSSKPAALLKQQGPDPEHISGAEGIYDITEARRIAAQYIRRALDHPRGCPDRITVTLEKITGRPLLITSLPVVTLQSETPAESARHAEQLLMCIGISSSAIKQAFRVLRGKRPMRGASLVLSRSGKRAEPDRVRGVRVSRLGITREALQTLSRRLSRRGINTSTVREAVILASKVAGCSAIEAEICISDDPDYTTGYLSSRKTGYMRIPHIKKEGSRSGGRVFFLREGADIDNTVAYLEQRPVIVSTVAACRGGISIDECLDNHHR